MSDVNRKIEDLVRQGEIPKDRSVLKTRDRYAGTTYWEVHWHIDDETIEDYLADLDRYGEDGVMSNIIYNNIFLLELPKDEFGGIALGDITDWKPSSKQEAIDNNYGY